jgi:hypothetical protein
MVDTNTKSGANGKNPDIVRRAFSNFANTKALPQLRQSLGDGPFAAVFLFVSSDANFAEIVQAAEIEFGGIPINACTTAGEISDEGYSEGGIVAVGLPTSNFDVRTIFVDNLKDISQEALVGTFIGHRQEMATLHPTWKFEFAFTLIDGLSMGEEALLQALGPGLGGIGLFGGSAGDGLKFEQTWVAHQGTIRRNAAVVAVVRTRCPVKVFSLDHFTPTDNYLVVTEADPETRTVTEINAEPAMSEYARILGLPAEQMDLHAFSANPLAIQVGDRHHVRAIMRGDADGTLEFASAIDVGLVLRSTVAGDVRKHLMEKLAELSNNVRPDAILACDCLARRVEIGDLQATSQISTILSDNSVIGFNTMGEQIDTLHVNHTMTGVAIYPPDDPGTDVLPS